MFVKYRPVVKVFNSGCGDPQALSLIETSNIPARTKLCRIMSRHRSDKSDYHNYTTVYYHLFARFVPSPIRILELGLGTNNPEHHSSMGIFGTAGASLRGWREFFPKALVFGADIDRITLIQEERIRTLYCNQLSPDAIRNLWSHAELGGGCHIIEDGLHTFEANTCFLDESLQHLLPGGF